MGTLTGQSGGSTGQRLETALLLRAYSAGLFPMADAREAEDVFWVEPRRRGVLPLDGFHLPRSLAKVLKQERFFHTRDVAFDYGMSEGNRVRFVRSGDCWELVEDPDPPSP